MQTGVNNYLLELRKYVEAGKIELIWNKSEGYLNRTLGTYRDGVTEEDITSLLNSIFDYYFKEYSKFGGEATFEWDKYSFKSHICCPLKLEENLEVCLKKLKKAIKDGTLDISWGYKKPVVIQVVSKDTCPLKLEYELRSIAINHFSKKYPIGEIHLDWNNHGNYSHINYRIPGMFFG